jgi:hypothetical protein
MRWVGHVANMGEKRNVYRVLMGKPAGNRPYGWILRKQNAKMWTGFSRVRTGTSGDVL